MSRYQMERRYIKQDKESSCEITDSGFSEDAKDGESTTNLCHKSELFVRSPSYDKATQDLEDEEYHSAQRKLMAQNEYGNTLLHEAIICGKQDTACRIAKVVESKDTLQLKNCFGKTPLVLSVERGMTALVKILIDEGVNLTCINYQNMDNILHIAAENTDVEMLQLFKSSLPNREILSKLAGQVNKQGHTPLHLAIIKKSLACFQILLTIGSNIDKKAYQDGYTCLHFAVLTEDASFLSAFLNSCQPDLEVKSYADQTAYELASENGLKAVMQVLVAAGALTEPDTCL